MEWNSMATIKLYLMRNTTKLDQPQRMHYQYHKPFLCSDTKQTIGRRYNKYHIDAIANRITWATNKKTSKSLLLTVLQNEGHKIEGKFCKTIKFNDYVPFFVILPPLTVLE